MRVLGLAAAGMLALTPPMTGHAAPLGSSMKHIVPAPDIVKVWGGCGWGWHPVPGHWSRWRSGWVLRHCAPKLYYGWWGPYWSWGGPYGVWGGPYGSDHNYGDWDSLWYPYRDWREPRGGWGNP